MTELEDHAEVVNKVISKMDNAFYDTSADTIYDMLIEIGLNYYKLSPIDLSRIAFSVYKTYDDEQNT